MNDTKALLSLLKLRFNIDHPSIEECYTFGYECGQAGIEIDENPFQTSSLEKDHWVEGWWAGFYGEKPLFNISDASEPKVIQEAVVAVNDHHYAESSKSDFFIKLLEITSVIGIAAMVGYQVFELVA